MMQTHLLLTTDVVGGVWDYSLTLARELVERHSTRVTILAFGEPATAQVRQAGATGARLIAEPLKLEWMQDSQFDVLRTGELIGRLVRELEVDVVHANQFAAARSELDVPVVLALHSDVLSWRRWTLGANETPDEWRGYAALVGEALAHADAIVAVSAFLAGEVRALYGCARPMRVIHNGWSAQPAGLRRQPRSPSTLAAGRAWDAAKGISLIAEAAEGWQPGVVHLAGEHAHPESGGHVEVPPPLRPLGYLSREELDQLMNTSRIYLSAARYDPFGLLPLQAALHGCALLLSDIPSYRELWAGAAVFFRSGDAADLRRQWARMLESADLVQEVAVRARQRAELRYSAARMADDYMSIYSAVSAQREAVAL